MTGLALRAMAFGLFMALALGVQSPRRAIRRPSGRNPRVLPASVKNRGAAGRPRWLDADEEVGGTKRRGGAVDYERDASKCFRSDSSSRS